MARPFLKRGLLVVMLSFVGQVEALSVNGVTAFGQIVTLNAATDGIIKTVAVRPGQQVDDGQVLIEMENTRQRAQFDKAEAVVKSLQPDVTIASLELERAQELYSLESLSQVDLQNAENKLMRAEGRLKAAQAEREIAADSLGRTVIKAPFPGVIDKLHTTAAQYVNPAVESAPLVTVVGIRSMIAIALLDAEQWNSGFVGKSATVRVAGKSFKGRVTHISRQPQRNSGGKAKFELHVSFSSDNPLAEGLPLTIDIKD